MADPVVKCLEHINDISNSNLVRNEDRFLSRQEGEVPIEWVGENKMRVPTQKFKVSC